MDWQRLARVVGTSVHLLDNVIDMNDYPIEEIARMSRNTRRIGVGVMGWSDLLVELGSATTPGSPEAGRRGNAVHPG